MTRCLHTGHVSHGAAGRPARLVGGEAGGRRRRTGKVPRARASTTTAVPFPAQFPRAGKVPTHDAHRDTSSAAATDFLRNEPEDPTPAQLSCPPKAAPETVSPHQPSSLHKPLLVSHHILRSQIPTPLPRNTQTNPLQIRNPPPKPHPKRLFLPPHVPPKTLEKLFYRHFPKAETGPAGDPVLAIRTFPAEG